ncbi:hypothetical protein BDZ88DRAFT_407622 [Geranomyces variabilis]|nr:hypothetical protein BDZ88DRAFT_407622 [Geranomyces variabilis]
MCKLDSFRFLRFSTPSLMRGACWPAALSSWIFAAAILFLSVRVIARTLSSLSPHLSRHLTAKMVSPEEISLAAGCALLLIIGIQEKFSAPHQLNAQVPPLQKTSTKN